MCALDAAAMHLEMPLAHAQGEEPSVGASAH